MTPTALHLIAAMRAGTVLEGIRGTLTKIYSDRKQGNNEHGDWSMQNATFRDDAGETIKVVFKNQEEIPQSWANRRLDIVTEGDSKARGVCVDEYQSKKRLLIYPTVRFDWLQDDAPAAQQQRRADPPPVRQGPPPEETRRNDPPARQDPPPARQEPQQRRQDPPTGQAQGADPYKCLRRDVAKMGLAFLTCWDGAVKVGFSVHHRHGHLMSPTDIKGLAMAMFIETNRQGQMAHWRGLPVVDLNEVPAPGKPQRGLTSALDALWAERHAQRNDAEHNVSPTRQEQRPQGWVDGDEDEIPF